MNEVWWVFPSCMHVYIIKSSKNFGTIRGYNHGDILPTVRNAFDSTKYLSLTLSPSS